MNKKIVISLSVIAVLLLYLLLANNKPSKNIPEIEEWVKECTEINIDKKGESLIKIYKKDNKWLVSEAGYPADNAKVKKLETTMKELKITDFVSKGSYYERYDLSPDKAIRVTVKRDDKILRDILLGKKSSTHRNTYVKFSNEKEIYLVSGGLADEFDKEVEEFRDKEIYSVGKDAVGSLELKYKGKKFTFEKIEEEKEEEGKPDSKVKEKKKKKVEKWVCKEFKRLKLDKKKVDALVNAFSSIKANSFPDIKKKSLKRPVCIIRGRAYNKDITLNIYTKDKDDKHLCSSSESPYVFTMNEWNAKQFFKKISDFTEKAKKKKKKLK